MLLKESWLFVADNTNIRWVKIFHLYKGFHRKSTTLGFFIKGSARVVEPPRIEYKGFKYKYSVKGDITRMLIVRTKRKEINASRNSLQFRNNSAVNIKKKVDMRSKYLNGPVSRQLNRRKLMSLFKKVIH